MPPVPPRPIKPAPRVGIFAFFLPPKAGGALRAGGALDFAALRFGGAFLAMLTSSFYIPTWAFLLFCGDRSVQLTLRSYLQLEKLFYHFLGHHGPRRTDVVAQM